MPENKSVVVVVIDALSSHVVNEAIQRGDLPTMAELVRRGEIVHECVCVFPSITPAATSSIATGTYPRDHGVTGAHFYDANDGAVRYFGNDVWPIFRESFSTYFEDFLVCLNRDCLRQPTLFETVEQNGRRAACINFMIFRGDCEHEVDVPYVLSLVPGVQTSRCVMGPTLLYEGDFIAGQTKADGTPLRGSGGVFHRFGFQDSTTAEILMELAKSDTHFDFVLAYFPDNDFDSHEKGPHEALATVQQVDAHLERFISASGGLDAFLHNTAVIILGDHSQSELCESYEERNIDMASLLEDYQLVQAGATWSDGDELLVCPNMRACQVYLRDNLNDELFEVVTRLLTHDRIDQVIWRSGTASPDGERFHVRRALGERLTFFRSDNGAPTVHDAWGNKWQFDGDLTAIDASLTASNKLTYGQYPNALERIANAFSDGTSGNIWITAKLGYEFTMPGTRLNRAGSHGSLHRLDSLTPLIAAGLPPGIHLSSDYRTIDVAQLCHRILGVS